jgi:hypothetical protein
MDIEIDINKAEAAYGSLKVWATRLGVPYTTVRSWRESKHGVPVWRKKVVATAAVEDGKDIFAAPAPIKKKARA